MKRLLGSGPGLLESSIIFNFILDTFTREDASLSRRLQSLLLPRRTLAAPFTFCSTSHCNASFDKAWGLLKLLRERSSSFTEGGVVIGSYQRCPVHLPSRKEDGNQAENQHRLA